MTKNKTSKRKNIAAEAERRRKSAPRTAARREALVNKPDRFRDAPILTSGDETLWRLAAILVSNTTRVTTEIEIGCADEYLPDLALSLAMASQGLHEAEECHPSVTWHLIEEIRKTCALLEEIGILTNVVTAVTDGLPQTTTADKADPVWSLVEHLLTLARTSTQVVVSAEYDFAGDYIHGHKRVYLEVGSWLNNRKLSLNYKLLALDLNDMIGRSIYALESAGYKVH